MTIAKNIQKLGSRKRSLVNRVESALEKHGKDAVPQLITAFESPDLVVRYRVAMILGRIGDSRALQPLMAHTRDIDEGVRYDSAMALGILGDPAAIPFLIDLCLHPVDDTNTDSAAWTSLYRMGEKSLPLLRAKMKEAITEDELQTLQELESRILDPEAYKYTRRKFL